MGPSALELMFNPKSIAVFGASDTKNSVGSMLYANLLAGAFKGELYAINPKHDKVQGKKCYRSILNIGDNVDLAVIASPANTVVHIIKECGEAGIKNVIVLSAGFGDGSGTVRLTEVKEAARRYGVRFMGPNCVGLVRPWIGMNATFQD